MFGKAILLLTTDEETADIFRRAAAETGVRLGLAKTLAEAYDRICNRHFDALFVHTGLDIKENSSVLASAAMNEAEIPVVAVSKVGAIREAVDAILAGASDYIKIPFESSETLRLAISNAELDQNMEPNRLALLDDWVAIEEADAPMLSLRKDVHKVASLGVPTLILGERGAGKSVFAREMHNCSALRQGPFITLHCGGSGQDELNGALFGEGTRHGDDGACSLSGKAAQSIGGTLFLHHTNVAAAAALPRLLHCEGPKGKGPRSLVVASSVEPSASPACAQFQEECSKAGLTPAIVEVPPLRDRTADIPSLCLYFARRFSDRHGTVFQEFSPEAMERLVRHLWPGNVEELEKTVEYALLGAAEGIIALKDLPPSLLEYQEKRDTQKQRTPQLKVALQESEKTLLLGALQAAQWNKKKVAKRLGISRSTLYVKMRQHNLLETSKVSENHEFAGQY